MERRPQPSGAVVLIDEWIVTVRGQASLADSEVAALRRAMVEVLEVCVTSIAALSEAIDVELST